MLHLNQVRQGSLIGGNKLAALSDVGQGFNSLVMLGAWILWKERNDIVFNGVSPRLHRALLLAQDEAAHWMLAGAKGLRGLVAASHGG